MKSRTRIVLVVMGLLVAAALGVLLFAFGATPSNQTPAELRAELEAELKAFEAARHPRPPLFDPAAEGAAADRYRAAFAALGAAFDRVGDEVRLAVEGWKGPPEPVPEAVRRFLPHATKFFDELRKGACAAEAGHLTRVRAGVFPTIADDVPFELSMALRRLVGAHAVVLAENGRPAEALEELLVLGRVGRDFGCGGGLVAGLLGVSVQACALTGLAHLLESGMLEHEERRTLRTHLESWWAVPPDRAAIAKGIDLEVQWMQRQAADLLAAGGESGESARAYRVLELLRETASGVSEAEAYDLDGYQSLLMSEATRLSVSVALTEGRDLNKEFGAVLGKWTFSLHKTEEVLRSIEKERACLLLALDNLDRLGEPR